MLVWNSSIKTDVGNNVVVDLGVGFFIYNQHGKQAGKQYLDSFFYLSSLSSLVKIKTWLQYRHLYFSYSTDIL